MMHKWPSNQARASGMRKLSIAQLGSDQIDQKEFSKYVVLETIKRILPLVLEKKVSVKKPTNVVK